MKSQELVLQIQKSQFDLFQRTPLQVKVVLADIGVFVDHSPVELVHFDFVPHGD